MGQTLGEKIFDEKDMLQHVQRVKELFSKANKEALDNALRSGDLPLTCKLLGVSQADLELFLKSGLREAQRIAKRHPEFAEAAKQKKQTMKK